MSTDLPDATRCPECRRAVDAEDVVETPAGRQECPSCGTRLEEQLPEGGS